MKIGINKITSLLLISVTFAFTACKKDHNILDSDTQPGNDELNAEQLLDLPVTAHTIFTDSIASFKERNKFLGSNLDPAFGRTDVGLYLNTSINVTNLNFGSTATLTSAEIVLAYEALKYVGDPAAKLTCSVFPVNQTLNPTGTYYSSNNRMHDPNPIFVTVATTTTAVNGQTILKIDFDKTYAANLMADTANLRNNDLFQAKYKGFYIAASISNGGDGIIYKLDLENDISGFYIYYKDQTDSIASHKFPFSGANTTKYNTIAYTPTQDLVNTVQDSSQGANKLFLKGFGNTKVKVQIPFLKNMSDSFYISVNRAEIIFYPDPTVVSTGLYEAPPVLSLLVMDSLGKERFTSDHRSNTTFDKYGGSYDPENKRYVFNIAAEAQAILSGKKKNRGFYLVVAKGVVGLKEIYSVDKSKDLLSLRRDNYAERVVLAGYNNITLKPRLNLSFVKLRNEIK